MLDSFLSGFADISLAQLALIAAMALLASVVGGVAGYGTGALMPLVLVPIMGAEPVVPILSLSALLTNTSRTAAFHRHVDGRRALIVLIAAVPTCVLGAWAYTKLSGVGALIVIGSMLIASVPLRRLLKRRGFGLSDRGLALAPSPIRRGMWSEGSACCPPCQRSRLQHWRCKWWSAWPRHRHPPSGLSARLAF